MATDEAPAPSSRRALLGALRVAGREHSDATVLFHTGVAHQLGLNATDAKALSVLQRRGPLAAGQIAVATGLTTAAVTTLIDRLERRGFVRRTRDVADRRRVIVEPTPEGIDRFAPFFASPQRSLGRLYAPYTDDELEVILDFLTRSTERLRSETARLPGVSEAADALDRP
ncbi:MAG: MarR family transcriptional regulator [Acidimicrobiales bacterium]